jgi:hypothetical protein
MEGERIQERSHEAEQEEERLRYRRQIHPLSFATAMACEQGSKP